MPKAQAKPKKKTQLEPTILFEADSTLLTTTLRIVLTGGTASEPQEKAGVANLVSELVLRGSRKKSRTELQSAFERMGAAFECAAGHDKIIYSGEVIRENTDAFLKLVIETLTQPAFSKKEFDALKKEILAEINHAKNSGGALGGLALRRALFEGSRLQYPGSGTLATVGSITLKDAKDYYKRHYTRANLLIGIASPLKEKPLREAMQKLAKGLEEGAAFEFSNTEPTIPTKPTVVVVDKSGTATGTVFLVQKGITAQDPDRFALDVGNFSFGGEPLVARLFRTIRGELGWTYSISASYSVMGALSHQRGVYAIVSTPSLEFTAGTITKSLEMWTEYLQKGVTPGELEMAQESVVNSYPFDFESADKRLSKRLYSHLYKVPILSPEDYSKTIHSIKNEQIQKALKHRHTDRGWWVVVVADARTVAKQLSEHQKEVPEGERLAISRQFKPDELVR